MKTKIIFLVAAVIGFILLVIAFIWLKLLPLGPSSPYSDRLGFYGVLVGIVAGIFTVAGLYWAATEFSESQVKPDLDLIIGTKHLAGILPLLVETDQLQGQDNIHSGVVRPPVSQIIFGLFLENKNPKAAQFIRITLRLKDVQMPSKFIVIKDSFAYEPRINTVHQEAIFLQFGEDLVVYKGDGVFLGNIWIEWDKEMRPEKLVLEAGLYNLTGEPKTVVVSRPISWN